MFSENDKRQLAERGISVDRVLQQLALFRKGIPEVDITQAATIGNGILCLSKRQQQEYVSLYDRVKNDLDILKFIPASGAASRIFKALFIFLEEFDVDRETLPDYIHRNHAWEIHTFFQAPERFPFYDEVFAALLDKIPDYKNQSDSYQKYQFVKEILTEQGCHYGSFPKALLPFHTYTSHRATAFEEHLFEMAAYGATNNQASLHFTITPLYRNDFIETLAAIRNVVERQTGIRFNVTFSYQKPSTDTIAVTTDNIPYRKDDHTLCFYPSGHGALIENLNALDADIIFIKNIDNVAVRRYEKPIAFHKKVLAGKLIALREKSFHYLALLENQMVSLHQIAEIQHFLTGKFNLQIPDGFTHFSKTIKIQYLKKKLYRPIRVCGMVKDEGAMGGGPFWVRDKKGEISLQIIEAAQMNMKSAFSKKIKGTVTHFNPVDIVCSIKDYQGKKYNLLDFAAHKQGFIVQKNNEGKNIKVLEMPGLWNGGMTYWNTVFIEVPSITFSPVKTINDLLQPTHQVK